MTTTKIKKDKLSELLEAEIRAKDRAKKISDEIAKLKQKVEADKKKQEKLVQEKQEKVITHIFASNNALGISPQLIEDWLLSQGFDKTVKR